MIPGRDEHRTRPPTARWVVVADTDGPPAHPRSDALVLGLRRRGAAVAACDCSGPDPHALARLSGAVRRTLEDGEEEDPVLVLFGGEVRQRRLVWGLALSGLLPRVRLVVHAAAAEIPYEPKCADLFARAHVVVTESELGARAVQRCCAEAAQPPPEVVVTSPAFPARSALPELAPTDRRALRRELMGVDDGALIVGCRMDEGQDELGPLILAIFQRFARGWYWRCDRCGHVTPWRVDDHVRPVPRDRCARCGSTDGAAGQARDDAYLYVTGEPVGQDDRWSTQTIGVRGGLGDRIVRESALPAVRSVEERWRRWSCVDIHLQPHLLADLPDSMRVSCVLGVPLVATRYGAVEERLGDAARLVPPRVVLDHSAGHRTALMDPGGAVAELCRLADDRQARLLAAHRERQLARRGSGGLPTRLADLLDSVDGSTR